MNNWYKQYKIASRVPTDIDVDYSEVKKPYVKSVVEQIKKILSQPNLEEMRKDVAESQNKKYEQDS